MKNRNDQIIYVSLASNLDAPFTAKVAAIHVLDAAETISLSEISPYFLGLALHNITAHADVAM